MSRRVLMRAKMEDTLRSNFQLFQRQCCWNNSEFGSGTISGNVTGGRTND